MIKLKKLCKCFGKLYSDSRRVQNKHSLTCNLQAHYYQNIELLAEMSFSTYSEVGM